jgi:hypothetical protein
MNHAVGGERSASPVIGRDRAAERVDGAALGRSERRIPKSYVVVARASETRAAAAGNDLHDDGVVPYTSQLDADHTGLGGQVDDPPPAREEVTQ